MRWLQLTGWPETRLRPSPRKSWPNRARALRATSGEEKQQVRSSKRFGARLELCCARRVSRRAIETGKHRVHFRGWGLPAQRTFQNLRRQLDVSRLGGSLGQQNDRFLIERVRLTEALRQMRQLGVLLLLNEQADKSWHSLLKRRVCIDCKSKPSGRSLRIALSR